MCGGHSLHCVSNSFTICPKLGTSLAWRSGRRTCRFKLWEDSLAYTLPDPWLPPAACRRPDIPNVVHRQLLPPCRSQAKIYLLAVAYISLGPYAISSIQPRPCP